MSKVAGQKSAKQSFRNMFKETKENFAKSQINYEQKYRKLAKTFGTDKLPTKTNL